MRKILFSEDVKSSGHNFRDITDQLPIGIIILQDGFVRYVNDALSNIIEYSKEEILNWSNDDFFKYVYPHDLPLIKEKFEQRQDMRIDGVLKYSFRAISKSKKIKWVELSSKSILYQGKAAILVSVIDLMEKKEAEQELKESEEKCKTILDGIVNGVWVTDKDDIIYYTNKGMEKIAGIPSEQIVNAKVLIDFPESTLKYFRPYYLKAKNTLNSVFYDAVPVETPASRQSFQSGWLIPIEKEGKYDGIICTVEDVTERKKAEEKLRDSEEVLRKLNKELDQKIEERTKELKESEEKFRNIADQSLMGIIIMQDDVIKYGNQRIADISGYSLEEIMNWQPKEFYKVIATESLDFVTEQAKKKQLGLPGTIPRYTFQIIKKSGEKIWIEIFSKTINFNGRLAILATFYDNTDKKKVEQKLKESEEKWQDAYNRMIFYQNLIAHDINNVFNGITTSIALSTLYQKDVEEGDEIIEILRDIEKLTELGGKIITNVRKMSLLEDSELILKRVEINKILDESIKYILTTFPQQIIRIDIEPLDKVFFTLANELLLDAFENILHNAVKYNYNPAVEVLIKISKFEKANENYIKLEFIDNGIGFPDKKKQLFFQHQLEIKIRNGMGLGLSLVDIIIKSYNGFLWVEDKVKGDYSKGSNFIILIPEI